MDVLEIGDPGTTQGALRVNHGGDPGEMGLVAMADINGKLYYLWVTDQGTVRTHDQQPESESDGVAVGSQF